MKNKDIDELDEKLSEHYFIIRYIISKIYRL